MKVKYQINSDIEVEIEGDTLKEVMDELSSAEQFFAHTVCQMPLKDGKCGAKANFVVRVIDSGDSYCEMQCTNPACNGRFSFGQSKTPKGFLYAKTRWNSLGDAEKESRGYDEEKHKNRFLPNGGWYRLKDLKNVVTKTQD